MVKCWMVQLNVLTSYLSLYDHHPSSNRDLLYTMMPRLQGVGCPIQLVNMSVVRCANVSVVRHVEVAVIHSKNIFFS